MLPGCGAQRSRAAQLPPPQHRQAAPGAPAGAEGSGVAGAHPRGWGNARRTRWPLLGRFEEALQEARQVDQLLAEAPGDGCLEEKFPLLGVPVTVKEAFSLHGAFAPTSLQPGRC